MATKLILNPGAAPFPYGPLVFATFVRPIIRIDIQFDSSVEKIVLEHNGSQVIAVNEIIHSLANAANYTSDSTNAPSFFTLANALPDMTAFPEIVAALDNLDDHLALRTFLIGHDITVADWAVWGALKSSTKVAGLLKNNQQPHLLRWYSHLESFQSTQDALAKLIEARSTKAKSNKTAGSFALGLPGAVEGQVVTRFPPEPSGYLHIGHAKAAMLNQYFANMYKGKLIIRFDDTNPSKETSEFEETILKDLTLLEIVGDRVTHTSDYFDQLYDLAAKLIKSGHAYADDTEQMKMRQERMDGIASARRTSTVQENLTRFAEMKTGSTEGQRWCVRAKISVDDPNKALRDPVVYRCNVSAHHRTGDKWKVYPTYDFACPVVDSLEGVTHALRTNEYRDRNPQYQWMIKSLGLRNVEVWDYSRLNFIYTLLSKRKLRWFVDQGLVRGWDDPRFPTVRGIRRRGLTVEALQQYMLSQGPSQAVVSLEWDSIWAINKKVIDPVAPRFWAVAKANMVKLTLNGSIPVEVKQNPKHKKNLEVGTKDTVYGPDIFVEQDDALSFEDQEEITLMDWGNAIIRSKSVSPSGTIESLTADLHLAGDFKKTKKKITWLADPASSMHPLVDVTLLDYDYLITKKKLEDEDDMADFVTPVTEFRVEAWADAGVKALDMGDIMQFERKGYYRVDNVARNDDGQEQIEFIRIPDGKAAGLASKSAPTQSSGATREKSKESKRKAPSSVHSAALNPNEGGAMLSNATTGFAIPVSTSMYEVRRIYGERAVDPKGDTKMYQATNVYEA